MLNLLSKLKIRLKALNDRAEQLTGKKLAIALIIVFVVFSLIGFSTNYFINKFLNNSETEEIPADNQLEVAQTTYKGIITYTNPLNYPDDKISFYLADPSGKEIVLLKAKDQKLEVSEGLFVEVTGRLSKTKDRQKDVLLVETVAINNN